MFVCLNCKKEHNGNYSNKNFCSRHCSRSYASKFVDKQKLSFKLRHLNKTHYIKCIGCGKDIEVSVNVTKSYCKDCRKSKQSCKVCGLVHKREKDSLCYHHKIIPTLIKYFNFDKNTLGTTKSLDEYKRIVNEINNLYWNHEKNINELIEIYKYPYKNPMNFSKIMNSLGIKRRDLSESIVIDFKNNKRRIPNNYSYHCGYHTSWEGKTFWYRSSYELDYAKELDEKKIRYEVEPFRIMYLKSIDNKNHIAIPDFYIPSTNTLIEIKSTYTYDEKDLYDKFCKYLQLGYNVKLIYEHKDINIETIPILKWYVPSWKEMQIENKSKSAHSN